MSGSKRATTKNNNVAAAAAFKSTSKRDALNTDSTKWRPAPGKSTNI